MSSSNPLAHATAQLRRCSSSPTVHSDDELSSDDEPFKPRAPSIVSITSLERPMRTHIRLFDNSNVGSASLATDASIQGRHLVGTNASGYIVYDCEITTSNGVKVRTLKRYSAFVSLRDDLAKVYPYQCASLPKLPPKSAKYRPSFLERRQNQLDLWLRTLLLHPSPISTCSITRDWVLDQ